MKAERISITLTRNQWEQVKSACIVIGENQREPTNKERENLRKMYLQLKQCFIKGG